MVSPFEREPEILIIAVAPWHYYTGDGRLIGQAGYMVNATTRFR